jgi:hypothetical protein
MFSFRDTIFATLRAVSRRQKPGSSQANDFRMSS